MNKTLVWLQAGGCGGCSMSMLCAENPSMFDALRFAGIDVLWHPSLSLDSGKFIRDQLDAIAAGEIQLDMLCVEGAVLRGPFHSGKFNMLGGTGRSVFDWVKALAPRARDVIAIGSCSAYGGMTAVGENEVDAVGLQYEGKLKGGALPEQFEAKSGLPVINISGCPTHPDWILDTLAMLAAGLLTRADLDSFGRPKFYTETLVHHACPKNEYYEYKASATELSELGCLMENLGCVGTQAVGDCNIRLWNGEGSCTRAGYPCINCTAPEFEEPHHPFTQTPKLAGIPTGLPTDMPKAWFMALASLSKAATPPRIATNARSDRIEVLPRTSEGKKK